MWKTLADRNTPLLDATRKQFHARQLAGIGILIGLVPVVWFMAFSEDCRGMTLLGAIRGCCEQLPTLVVVNKDSEQARAFACANGARFCLSKSVSPVQLANAIADLELAAPQLAVA